MTRCRVRHRHRRRRRRGRDGFLGDRFSSEKRLPRRRRAFQRGLRADDKIEARGQKTREQCKRWKSSEDDAMRYSRYTIAAYYTHARETSVQRFTDRRDSVVDPIVFGEGLRASPLG